MEVSGAKYLIPKLVKLASMSPDANGLPTLNALGWLDVETDLNREDFLDITFEWLQTQRNDIAQRRLHGQN